MSMAREERGGSERAVLLLIVSREISYSELVRLKLAECKTGWKPRDLVRQNVVYADGWNLVLYLACKLRYWAVVKGGRGHMYAHYFESKTRKDLFLTETPSLRGNEAPAIPVSGKKEARRIAKESGAQPWNF